MGKKQHILGTRIGGLQILEIASSTKTKHGAYYVKYRCLCDCGEYKLIPHCHLISKKRPTVSCGCLQRKQASEVNIQHGLRRHRIYSIWSCMRRRCLNIRDEAYPKYGGAGVTLCERWLSFKKFYEDMGLPPEGYSINRVNGAKIYSKETCEWASSTTQCYDQKMRHSNTSGRTGVCWDEGSGKWLAFISKDRVQTKLGRFISFEDAVIAREEAEIFYYGKYKQEVLI